MKDIIELLSEDGLSCVIAGGTDLVPQMRCGIRQPERLISIKDIPGLNMIQTSNGEGLTMGMSATLDDILQNEIIRISYPVLWQAISVTASPQLRNRGTIGGNLNQASRCWYYRGDFHCWLKGGEICYARDGENQKHAIFGGGPCYTVNPSDLAPVLVALKANLEIFGPDGRRILPVENFFQIPHEGSRQLNILSPREIITGISISFPASNSRSIYVKAMERRVWSFALSSVAAQVMFEKGKVAGISVVLGGVAPRPWRLNEVESRLRGSILDDITINTVLEEAVAGAQPLSKNAYKGNLIKGLVKKALMSLRHDIGL